MIDQLHPSNDSKKDKATLEVSLQICFSFSLCSFADEKGRTFLQSSFVTANMHTHIDVCYRKVRGRKKARPRELKNLQKSWTYRTTVPRLSHAHGGREEAWTFLPLSDGAGWLVWDFLSKPEFQNHCHQRKRKWKKSVLLGFCFGEVSRGQELILLSSYIWVRAEAVKLTHQASTYTRFFQSIQEWLRCSKVAPHLIQLFATKIRSNFNYSTDWSFSDRFSKEPNKEKCPVPIKR